MSAILSADDLNDFISPGVACIKPVETLPLQKPAEPGNLYEVTTEDKLHSEPPPPAQISLTDCLACSGCVTSAEAVLVSLQSHSEVLHALDSSPSLPLPSLQANRINGTALSHENGHPVVRDAGRVFVASVSPQVRASLAATYGTTEQEAGWMIEQLLSGPCGLGVGGQYGNSFTWVVDTNAMREACLVMGAEEVLQFSSHQTPGERNSLNGATFSTPQKPILTSACPGWICYAEKTHPHILPHLSRLKSPQALTGTLLKTVLSKTLNISPTQIWHLAIMPCFDKKLEASRTELTSAHWSSNSTISTAQPVRDVDCVITAREVLMLAESRGISFPALPRSPLDPKTHIPFPDPFIDAFLFPQHQSHSSRRKTRHPQTPAAGTSGGYLHHILLTQESLHPGSTLTTTRGRNADVVEYALSRNNEVVFRAARYYGFRNIQNLVRKLRPVKKSRMPGATRKPGAGSVGAGGGRAGDGKGEGGVEYAYVEVMACPGGCTNGGGQIKVEDLGALQGRSIGAGGQKEWASRVDEAYFSMSEGENEAEERGEGEREGSIGGIDTKRVKEMLEYWARCTGFELERLLYTSFRAVESEVGKGKRDTERVVELAGKIGGGW